MARIRTIKPDFWTDEKVVELSAFARLLFIGLWNFADDEGRMVLSEKKIKMQIFPSDTLNISELFGEIRREKLVTVYEIDNVQYLQIDNFSKHQKIDKRSASKLPPNSSTPPELPRTPTTEGKGREEEGKGKDSDSKESGEPGSPIDFKKVIFDQGLKFLSERTDKLPEKLRPLLGKWCKDFGEGKTAAALVEAQKSSAVEPVAYIEKILDGGGKKKNNGVAEFKSSKPERPPTDAERYKNLKFDQKMMKYVQIADESWMREYEARNQPEARHA